MSDVKLSRRAYLGTTSFDAWVRRGTARNDRDQFITLMLADGRGLREIGDALGITGERVRQLADRMGIRRTAMGRMPLERIVAALRSRTATGLTEAAALCGCDHTTFRHDLKRSGLLPAALRLFHWRRTYPTRQRYATILTGLAARIGRTPTQRELAVEMHLPVNGVAPVLVSAFGSMAAAWRYCNLVPNSRGTTGHRNPETCQCRAHTIRRNRLARIASLKTGAA